MNAGLPAGWSEDQRTGSVACPHRDLSVCDGCMASRAECVEIFGAVFWIGDRSERELLAEMLDAETALLTCPADPEPCVLGVELTGCGRSFVAAVAGDDFDGMVDCPFCGLCFEPGVRT